jgi:hypothetical protein
MDSSTSWGAREPQRPRERPAGGSTSKRSRRPVFDKEHATLWLLTLSLGLGLGAVVRLVERPNPTSATAQVGQFAAQQAPSPGYGSAGSVPYQNQRVTVLPQRSFSARGTTRMS